MSKLTESIGILKQKRAEAINLQKQIQEKRANNDVFQFYVDSLKFSNVNDGMVIIITDKDVIKEKAIGGISHKKIAQEILDNVSDKHIDLGASDGDFGDDIPLEYGYIFIRMCSVLNGPTIIYFPQKCNDFQVDELSKFSEDTKAFNSTQKRDEFKISFEYNGKNDEVANDLDDLVARLNTKSRGSM